MPGKVAESRRYCQIIHRGLTCGTVLDRITAMISKIKPFLSRVFSHPLLSFKRFSITDTGVSADALAAALVKTELFCNAGSRLVRAMLVAMTVRRVHAGDVILRQGRRHDSLVLLAAGKAEVTRAHDGDRAVRKLAVLTKPECLGEEALLGAEIRSISVTMQTDGFILRIRRADFARLVSDQGVSWLTAEAAEDMPQPPGAWLWIGTPDTRPAGMGVSVPTDTLYRLRQRLSELDPARHYLCCGRDEASCALAAYLLTRRGFKSSAVRGGRHVAVPGRAPRKG